MMLSCENRGQPDCRAWRGDATEGRLPQPLFACAIAIMLGCAPGGNENARARRSAGQSESFSGVENGRTVHGPAGWRNPYSPGGTTPIGGPPMVIPSRPSLRRPLFHVASFRADRRLAALALLSIDVGLLACWPTMSGRPFAPGRDRYRWWMVHEGRKTYRRISL
jgi:hypothetical protein